MNNLKRVLSMALASVMLVGMMAVGASAADFTDADKIEYANAVETLVALKVINGKPDGSFDPQGDVTRAEMAKMIAVAMNGGSDTTTGVKGVASFTDISGNWAESYIEYCADLGIISGRGDGTFGPNDNVTGLEATKMVLTALGYDATAYRLTGASWAVRTDELARQASPNLYTNMVGRSMAVPASREVAAQLIWNGLQNTTRKVTPSTNTSTGEVTWTYNTGKMMLNERYGAEVWVGTYMGNDKNIASAKKGEIVVDGIIEGATDGNGNPASASRASFPSDMGIENIGEEVKVIFKDGGSGNTKGKPDSKDTIYGVFNTGATQVVKTTRGLIKDNKTADAQINVDGAKYDVADSVTIYTNYATSSVTTGVKGTDSAANVEGTNSALTRNLQAFNGNTIKFVFNSDNEIFAAYVEESVLGVVSAVSNGKVTISSVYKTIGTLNVADNDIYDGAAKGDVVVVKTLYNTNPTDAKAFNIVTKADVVSGTVDSYKDTENVVVDGSTYELYNHVASMHTANLTDAVANFSDSCLGEDFDLYLVNGYVAAAVQTSEGSSNYSVVVDSNAATSTLGSAISGTQIVVLGADGIRTTLTVSSESVIRTSATTTTKMTNTNKSTALVKGAIVTYTIDRNGDAEVTVEAQPATAASAKQIEYLKATKTVKLNGKTYTVASDAALFGYVDAATAAAESDVAQFKTYTLRQMGDNAVAAGGKYSVVLDKDGVVKAVYINQGAKPTGATDNTVYGIVTAKVGAVRIDGADYVRYTVGVNEDTYTVNISSTLASTMEADRVTPLKKGAIVRLDPTADNIYTATEFKAVKSTDADTIVGFSKEYNEADGTVTVFTSVKKNGAIYEGTNAVTYAVADDVNIFYVDQDADVGVLGAVGEFDAINGIQNIVIILDKDEAITDIVYETSGKWSILNAGL